MRYLLVMLVFFWCGGGVLAQEGAGCPASPYPCAEAFRSLISYLAHDSLDGRAAGSAGNREVTGFIAGYFHQIGLRPFTDSGFQQPFYREKENPDHVTSNVIGFLPGRTRPGEIVMISAHFDHVTAGYPGDNDRDGIYNGANDNASGTAMMLLLARYYALTGSNNRSLMFCAFNAEESGLLGSEFLARSMGLDSVVAGINLEMLGFPLFGKNTLMVTGMKQSGLPAILAKNLQGTGVRLRRERGDLFARSDNYSFAYRGVPSHSIMAGDDREPCYHRPCDEAERMDTNNMENLARAIIQALGTIISGEETPRRARGR